MGVLTNRTRLEKILGSLLVVVSIIAISFIIAFAVKGSAPPPPKQNIYSQKVLYDPSRSSRIRNALFGKLTQGPIINGGDLTGSAKRIRDNLRVLTKSVHVAGSKEQLALMDYVKQRYENIGLDRVDFANYDVFLNFPNASNPNTVSILNAGGTFDIVSHGLGQPVGPIDAQTEQNASSNARVWWNAFAKSATVTGTLVYANHGTLTDFQYLDNLNVSMNNSIVLVRYGKLWRGAKVYEAQKRGAIGVILFSDPQDYGPPKGSGINPFPDSAYLPPNGAQRGTLVMGDGDLATPYYPSKPYVHREYTMDELRGQLKYPNVPVMPIGYGDAQNLLESMNGQPAPASFQGGINVTGLYKLNSNVMYKLQVNGHDDPAAKIKNVIGYVVGSEEPDHWVLVSNHVDAWTYGSQDPNSGTAVILEMSRALMAVVNETGWRPKRTIVFCSWDAEEYGLIGSNEWSEEYLKVLESRAVALVNVDIAVKGTTSLDAEVVPLLYRAMTEAAMQVSNPNVSEISLGRKTVYDTWAYYYNKSNLVDDPSIPYMDVPGSGSDHSRFLNFIGVPVIDMSYGYQPHAYNLYHTMYEVSWLVEHVVDVDFSTHVSMAQLWLETIRNLADSPVIPFNVADYANKMYSKYVPDLLSLMSTQGMNKSTTIPDFNDKAAMLADAASRFWTSAKIFQSYVDDINKGKVSASLKQVQMLNERFVAIERAFINPRGLPRRGDYRHVVFAASVHDTYSGVLFAGIVDSIEDYQNAASRGDTTQVKEWIKLIRLALTDVQFSIESVILLLDLQAFY